MVKFKIKDQNWKAFVLDHDEYEAKFQEEMGRDTAALTDIANRQVFIDETELNLTNVIHEMGHIFVTFLHVNSANLTADQMEEVMVELWANEGAEILKTAKNLYKRLKKENG